MILEPIYDYHAAIAVAEANAKFLRRRFFVFFKGMCVDTPYTVSDEPLDDSGDYKSIAEIDPVTN